MLKAIAFTLLLPLAAVWAAGEEPAGEKKTPSTLAEVQAELERMLPPVLAKVHEEWERLLPPEKLAEIDAMESEGELIKYHNPSLGISVQERWGKAVQNSYYKHVRELRYIHGESITGVLLQTFWCRRHGKPLRVSDHAAQHAAYWVKNRTDDAEEEKRVESAKKKMRSMMMGLALDSREAGTIKMPKRKDEGKKARFLTRYNGGVLLGIKKNFYSEFSIEPYFYSATDKKIHKVNVPEIQKIDSVVLAGATLWLCGTYDDAPVLLGIAPGGKRINQNLPQNLPKADGGLPQLGLHGESLLAVYPKSVYKLSDGKWKAIYEGDVKLPKSGLPPRLVGDTLYLREEERTNDMLWFLKTGKNSKLVSLVDDVGVVGRDGPRWEDASSYAATEAGELWVCVGGGIQRTSLLHKSKDGAYSIALMNNSLNFTPNLFGCEETDQGLSVSAVTLLQDGTVLLVGDSGLYHLKGKTLIRKVAFTNMRQKIPMGIGSVYHWAWEPSDVLVLGEDSYFISGMYGGIYLLQKNEKDKWAFQSLDEKLGEPLAW